MNNKLYISAVLIFSAFPQLIGLHFCRARTQVRNMAANLTTNERINRKRYPWLNAFVPGGPPFNRYDRGLWGNLVEFWGTGTGCFGGGVGSGGDGEDAAGIGQRHPRDYLEVWIFFFLYYRGMGYNRGVSVCRVVPVVFCGLI